MSRAIGWLIILPLLLLATGGGFGFIGGSLVARYFFAASIILSFIIAIVNGVIRYKSTPRLSEAYVTWGAFLTVHMSTFIMIIAALLWIAFELGRVAGKLG